MIKTKPDISIIGAGVVGTALGVLAVRAGYRVSAVASRSKESARNAVRIIGSGIACSVHEAAARAQLLLLTVPDDALGPLAEELACAHAVHQATIVAHCSGALGSDVLAALADRCGAGLASIHPLQTFPSVLVAVDNLAGCYFFCEGHTQAVSTVMQLAGDIGGIPVEIEPDRKTLYHAAACIACNYLATLQEAAIAAAVLAGIGAEPARQALAPLVAATANNVMQLGPALALTGPIARGDKQTIANHLAALDATDSELAELYRQLGRRTVALAQNAGKIAPETARQLLKTLA
ncbi:MAG: DUF2520 domain-containing protein [Planctomycetes bacterium]|nr:DUF2520 domain-containing protein [Planctomycetota bacterium]